MKVRFNFSLDRKLFFEIRLVKSMFYSLPILGVFINKYSLALVIYPFTFSAQMMRKIEPTPITKEEEDEYSRTDP